MGRCGRVLREHRQDIPRCRDREHERARKHLPLHRVQAELEAGDDAEVAAAASCSPEQVLILAGAGVPTSPASSNEPRNAAASSSTSAPRIKRNTRHSATRVRDERNARYNCVHVI